MDNNYSIRIWCPFGSPAFPFHFKYPSFLIVLFMLVVLSTAFSLTLYGYLLWFSQNIPLASMQQLPIYSVSPCFGPASWSTLEHYNPPNSQMKLDIIFSPTSLNFHFTDKDIVCFLCTTPPLLCFACITPIMKCLWMKLAKHQNFYRPIPEVDIE